MRWRSHDTCYFNAGGTLKEGEFLGYAGNQKARVLLWDLGFKTVPIVALTRKEKVCKDVE